MSISCCQRAFGPVGRGVAVGVFVEGVADFVEGWFGDGRGGRGEDEVRGAELGAVGGDLEVGYVFEVPVDAVEEGGEGGGVDLNVAGGAGDVEGVGLVGVEGEVELGGEVGHEAVEDGFGGGDGGGRGGLGCGSGGEGEEERGAAEEFRWKHGNTISLEDILRRW